MQREPDNSISEGDLGEYDDSTDSSEEEFMRQQLEKQKVSLPRKSSTILVAKGTPAVLLEDTNVAKAGPDSDDEDMNATNIPRFQTSARFDVAIAQTAGRRSYNEDRVAVCTNTCGGDVYAVFDGHNGHEAATVCTEVLEATLAATKADPAALFAELHAQVVARTNAGCTATVALLREHDMTVACCGDSPAFVLKKDLSLIKVTTDHKASDPEEEKMIVANGGIVLSLCGMKRVNGQIIITRSIGDKNLHPPMTCVPSVQTLPLDDIKCVVLVSDGVTDVLESAPPD